MKIKVLALGFQFFFRAFIGDHDFQHDTMTVSIVTGIIGSEHDEILQGLFRK